MANVNNPWRRKGLFYYARVNVFQFHFYQGTILKRLDPISYHLIKWYHGEEKLAKMAATIRIKP